MNVLIVIDKPPYGRWSGREALDMALSLAAFDQPVSVLFRDGGVAWLRKHQTAADVGQKNADRNLAAAPIFGIDELLADRASVTRHGLDDESMMTGITLVDDASGLLANYRHVVCL